MKDREIKKHVDGNCGSKSGKGDKTNIKTVKAEMVEERMVEEEIKKQNDKEFGGGGKKIYIKRKRDLVVVERRNGRIEKDKGTQS